MMLMAETRLLFVCLSNICRSPLAEGAFRRLIDRHERIDDYVVASAGLGRWHSGAPADARAVAAGRKRGIDISSHRARHVVEHDFREFDLILALDRQNLAHLRAIAPAEQRHKMHLLLDYAPWLGFDSVADPAPRGGSAYDDAVAIIESGVDGLLAEIDQSRAALESS